MFATVAGGLFAIGALTRGGVALVPSRASRTLRRSASRAFGASATRSCGWLDGVRVALSGGIAGADFECEMPGGLGADAVTGGAGERAGSFGGLSRGNAGDFTDCADSDGSGARGDTGGFEGATGFGATSDLAGFTGMPGFAGCAACAGTAGFAAAIGGIGASSPCENATPIGRRGAGAAGYIPDDVRGLGGITVAARGAGRAGAAGGSVTFAAGGGGGAA